jgi:hypothetical protein
MTLVLNQDGSNATPAATDGPLVAAVLAIQRLVSAGAPAQATYQAICDHSMRLVGADSGALRFVDIADPSWTVAVAWCGAAGRGERWRQRSRSARG